jgi:CheY-like chemotaxis protein
VSVKVLVADDNQENNEIFRKRFEQLGLSVVFVSEGSKVVEVVSEELPDIVLLELSLPGVDGLNITSALKRKSATKRIPIVGLSSNLSADDRIVLENVGFDDFCIKPIKIKELITKIKEWIKKSRQAS